METTTLKVKGMSCQHCVKTIETTVSRLPGVGKVEVDLGRAEARVTYEPTATPLDRIVRTIEDQGYEAQAR
jgi:copper chaperone